MNRDLSNYRETYDKGDLLLKNCALNPIEQFSIWFKEVENAGGVREPNAMMLTTLGADGFPKGRIVLLKEFNQDGFIFYTNYTSEKGVSIANYPKVGLSFFWPNLERQVLVKGTITKVSPEKSDSYFNSRPKASQLGALVSPQSTPIKDRSILEEKLESLQEEYKDTEVKRPYNWGGYIVKPAYIEFWQGRPSRLHDRILYTKEADVDWKKQRLAP